MSNEEKLDLLIKELMRLNAYYNTESDKYIKSLIKEGMILLNSEFIKLYEKTYKA